MIPRISHRRFAIAAIALAALAAVASAASPNILRHVIAGGGRRSVGGAYVVTGTIGQALAGPVSGPMTGGPYSVQSGFWPGPGPIQCLADYNLDGEVDILDFLDFMNDFGTCNGQPAPCGETFDADLTGDTIVDILDFLDFMDAFGSGC
ncbi:MAG: hypothetical protein KF912_13215 [Phycisphaeraceae bacterium]|nr:hypothetical protein [Phycisphaeraceae bacterium]QYK47968.1 MAG: hypothetical protein KF838_14405 [Phycisphaeraceae bacterium]